MFTAVIALMAAMVGAFFGFMLCAMFTVGKIADLEQKLVDTQKDRG